MSDTTAVATVDHAPVAAAVPTHGSAAIMSIVERAMERGATLEQIERLLAMHKQVRDDEARRAFAAAVSAAKAEIKPIEKKRTVDFTSTKGRTHYRYEDMALIADHIDPILAKYGLSYRHRSKQDNGVLHVGCVLAHRDGYEEETWLAAPRDESGNKNAIQSIASTATYLQRYTLKLALGLAAGPDTDGRVPPAPVDKITPDQAGEIRELVESIDGDTNEFCKFYRVAVVGDLPATRFAEAMAAIKSRMAAKRRGK